MEPEAIESRVPVQKSTVLLRGREIDEKKWKWGGQMTGSGRIGERQSHTAIFIGGLILGYPLTKDVAPSTLGKDPRDMSPDPVPPIFTPRPAIYTV
jgi:hypothetical protein